MEKVLCPYCMSNTEGKKRVRVVTRHGENIKNNHIICL